MAVETMAFGPLVVTFDDEVLRPRPWTMLQASWAAELATDRRPGAILELCSGVGHIGQAAAVLTGRGLVQVDIDAHACELAERNATANVRGTRVEVRCGDLDAVLDPSERFALVLADPPYVPEDQVDTLPDDPDHAIDGGRDGLELLRRCVAVAGAHVDADGVVLVQTLGRGQVEALAPEVAAAGLELVDIRAEDERRAVAYLRPAGARSTPTSR